MWTWIKLEQDKTEIWTRKLPCYRYNHSDRVDELLNTKMNFRFKLFHWVTNSTNGISTNPKPKALPTILQHTASFCSNYPSSTVSLPLQLTTVRATEQSVLKLWFLENECEITWIIWLQGNYTVISALSVPVPPFLFGLSWLEMARFREQGRQKVQKEKQKKWIEILWVK